VLVELFCIFFFGGWIRFFVFYFVHCYTLPYTHSSLVAFILLDLYYMMTFCFIERYLLRTLVPPSSDMISFCLIRVIENSLFFLSKPCHSCFTPLYHKSDVPTQTTPGIPSLPFINCRHSAFVLVREETAIR